MLTLSIDLVDASEALIQPELPDLGWPKEARRCTRDLTKAGWLLKRNARSGFLAQATVGSIARNLFWTWRYFEIRPEYLAYWESENARDADVECSAPRGVFTLKDIDGVAVRGQEVTLQFCSKQQTGTRKRPRTYLRLRCASSNDAERWGAGLRHAAAESIRERVPHEWDVDAMLSIDTSPAVRLVAEVPLSQGWTLAMQRLLDYTYVFKRTKDRHNRELPVRLEVQQVVGVQNFAAWMKYTSAREALSYKLTTLRVLNAEHAKMIPQVHTATHDDPIVTAALGEMSEQANEHWLFHGTSVAGVTGIASRDFKIDLAGTHRGTLYGKGLYLAECSTKADEYAEEDENGNCHMILCRVALGRVLVDSAPSPNTPELESQVKKGFDSLCGDRWAAVGTYREYVLFNQGLVYPAYIITYKRVSQGALLSAIGAAATQGEEATARRLIPEAARLAQMHLDPVVRYRVCMLLSAHLLLVAPTLVDSLRDARPAVRQTAAFMLGQLGSNSSSSSSIAVSSKGDDLTKTISKYAVPALTVALRDKEVKVRRVAASALIQFGAHAASAVPVLVECLGNAEEHEHVREAVAKALGQLGSKLRHEAADMPALAAIVARGLQDAHVGVRRAVATTLGQIGEAAAVTVPMLTLCLEDIAEEVRTAAATALWSMPGASATNALPALVACLSDPSSDVQAAAATALGRIGEDAGAETDHASAVTALASTCQDLTASSAVRKSCIFALGQFGAHAQPAVSPLARIAKDPSLDSEVRVATTQALGQLGTVAAPAVPALRSLLRETSDALRKAGVIALGAMGAAAAPALPSLTERIKDSNAEVRKAASAALAGLGIHAAPAVPLLEMLREDAMQEVRDLANMARKQILAQLSAVEQEAAEELAMQASDDGGLTPGGYRNRTSTISDGSDIGQYVGQGGLEHSEDGDTREDSVEDLVHHPKVGDKLELRSNVVAFQRSDGFARAAVEKFPRLCAGLPSVVEITEVENARVHVRGVSASIRCYKGWIDVADALEQEILR